MKYKISIQFSFFSRIYLFLFIFTAIEFSGPIYIKLGQWISTRRDLFPDECCLQFSKLQRSAKPHSWAFTKHRLQKAFGTHWRQIVVKVDNDCEPVGSGCVAQVSPYPAMKILIYFDFMKKFYDKY